MDEYQRRLDESVTRTTALAAVDRRFVRVRIVVFLMLIAVGCICLGDPDVGWLWILLPIAAFAAVVSAHARILRRLRLQRRVTNYYRQSLDRLAGNWSAVDECGARFLDPSHAWSADLDLFGKGSLFQMLNQCRTRPAMRLLAEWMTRVPDGAEVRRRQQQAESLRSELDLRERLAVIDNSADWDSAESTIDGWITEPATLVPRWILLSTSALGIIAVPIFAAVAIELLPLTALLLILLLQVPFIYLTRQQIQTVSRAVDDVDHALRQLSDVIAEFESHRFDDHSLCDMQARFRCEGHVASEEIQRLSTQIQWLNNALRNQFFAPIGWICGLLIILTHRIESWRQNHGQVISDWMEAAATLEVLLALGAFSFDHDDWVLPNITDSAGFKAKQIGHPLLAPEACVRNDVSLSCAQPLMLISGSNMSGKSTLLRSVGTNMVLTFCGARVNAESLDVYPFQLATAMRASDSLQEGKSLFFSVVQRLKTVVDLADGSHTVLFLLDEILHGTNSNDRRRGAQAVIQTLVERGGQGMVTTHDLALTEIVDSMDGKAVNKHFEDHIEHGKMTFDYKLRDGVVERSNAIELMRMMGLDV